MVSVKQKKETLMSFTPINRQPHFFYFLFFKNWFLYKVCKKWVCDGKFPPTIITYLIITLIITI